MAAFRPRLGAASLKLTRSISSVLPCQSFRPRLGAASLKLR